MHAPALPGTRCGSAGAARLHASAPFVPEDLEPTIQGGSPRPRRRSGPRCENGQPPTIAPSNPSNPTYSMGFSRQCDGEMSPTYIAMGAKPPVRNMPSAMSDDALRAAFGVTSIHVADRPPTPPAGEDKRVQAELDAMKNLSLKDLMQRFKGENTPGAHKESVGSPESRTSSASPPFDDSPWRRPVMWSRAMPGAPPLPPGPPPGHLQDTLWRDVAARGHFQAPVPTRDTYYSSTC